MKTVESVSNELNKKLVHITNFEKTKILVMTDRIISKSYSNHRLELHYYSIRYNANEKMIYVYNKVEDKNEEYDYDYIDKIDFPEDFSIKITIDSTMELFVRSLKLNIGRLCSLCLSLLI